MKRISSTLYAVVAFVWALAIAKGALAEFKYKAQTVNGVEWTYYVTNGEATIGIEDNNNAVARAIGGVSAITAPSKLGGYPVTAIGDGAFTWCNFERITIPSSVKRIGNGAFSGCINLKSVTIPSSVKSIGDRAFGGCSALQSIVIPDGVTEIADYMFDNCSSLTSVTIPSSVKRIGEWAFGGCSGLESLSIPASVTNIDTWAFVNCGNLASINIPASVTSMGDGVFENCSDSLFDMATIPGVKLLDGWVVGYDDSLSGDVVLNGVRGIAGGAFYKCGGLTGVTIPASVTSIGRIAFCECPLLSSITVAQDNPNYKSVNGMLLTKDGKTLLQGVRGAVSIPEGVTTIGANAFQRCGVSGVTIPESVTKIGFQAFAKCASLESVTIPASVASIGDAAFYDCLNLKNVTMPGSVSSIGDHAFYGCNGLADENGLIIVANVVYGYCGDGGDIAIPYGVTRISNEAFSLKAITGVTIPDTLTSIGDYAFWRCSYLARVTIGSRVTSIGAGAFSGCSGLTSVTIPDSVTEIGAHAFGDCSSLTNVTMPNSVKSIGEGAFSGCSGLTSVTIPDSVTEIGAQAFGGCTSLESVTIPKRVTEISNFLFTWCSGLTSVTMPEGVTVIGEGAFQGCTGLTNVKIPETVTRIRGYAFYQCSGLTHIIIPERVAHIGYSAFMDIGRCTFQFDGPPPEIMPGYSVFYTYGASYKGLYKQKYAAAWKAVFKPNLGSYYHGVMMYLGCDVTLNANGGALEGDGKILVAKGKALGVLPAYPKREGFACKGWFTAKSKGTKITAKTKVTKNVTYYAQWTAKKYPVSVQVEGKGKVTGTGSKAYKSKVTLKATPSKGHVFYGWYNADGNLVSQKASYTLTVPLGGARYIAEFITAAEDRNSIGLAYDGVDFEGTLADAVTNTCGVVAAWPLNAHALTATSITVKGQPTGMVWNKAKGAVTGVPAVANKSGTMTVTVKSAGGSKSFKVKWHITPLWKGAYGTFNGWTDATNKVVVAVSSAGKITAKVGSISLSRTGWAEAEDGTYTAKLSAKRKVGTGKKAKTYFDTLTLSLDPGAGWSERQLTGVFETTQRVSEEVLEAQRNPFGDNADAKALLQEIRAADFGELPAGVTLKVNSKTGVATFTKTTGSGKKKKTASATNVLEVQNGEEEGTYVAIGRAFVGGTFVEAIWP